MNKVNEEEISKQIEEFVRKSVLVILNARISSQGNVNANAFENSKMNSKFFTNEQEQFDLDEIFLDEYDELRSSKSPQKVYFLEISFKRKDLRILVERWRFNFKNSENVNKKSLSRYLKIKLNTMMRSIYTLTRILPSYSIFQKSGFNFSLDYKFHMDLSKQDTFLSKNCNMKLDNLSLLTNFSLEVDYLEKNEVFKLENDFNKIEKDNVIFRRPRYLSEDNSHLKMMNPSFEILNFEDTSINDNYFSKNPECNKTRIKRVTSEEVFNNNKLVNEKLGLNEPFQQEHKATLSLSDSISSNNKEFNDKLHYCSDSFSSYKKNMMKLQQKLNNNFLTSHTSSSIASCDSFELEIEDDNSDISSIIDFENEELNFKVEEIFSKLRNLKRELKTNPNRLTHFNFINFYNTYNKILITQKGEFK